MTKYAKWFWRQMEGIRLRLLVRIFAGLIQVGLGLLLVWLSRRFIDVSIWQDGIWKDTVVLLSVVTLLVLVREVVYFLTNTADCLLENSMRQRLFQLVLGRKMYADAGSLHSGGVCQRLEQDVYTVGIIITEVLPDMVVTVAQLVSAFLLMRYFDSWLAWSLLLSTPVIVATAKYLSHRLKQMTLDIRDEESMVQKSIQEGVEQSLAVKVLQGEGVMAGRLGRLHSHLQSLVFRRVRFILVSRLLLGLSFGFGYFGAFIYGGIQLRNGVITIGVMTAFLQLVSQIQSPIMTLLGMIPQLIRSAASVDRISEIERLEQEPPLPPPPFRLAAAAWASGWKTLLIPIPMRTPRFSPPSAMISSPARLLPCWARRDRARPPSCASSAVSSCRRKARFRFMTARAERRSPAWKCASISSTSRRVTR